MLKKAILLLVASFFFVLVFRSQKGISALNSNNVRGRLNIYRDHLGVAHIMADNRNDLFYGAGYTQAQDRLWTLHFKLRFLEGRVSELFGQAVLPLDRYIRNVNLRDIGIMNAQHMDPQTRSYVQSYVYGINDYAKSVKIWPIEFYLFWTNWEDFTPAHVNSMMALFSLSLEFDWMYEIARQRLKEAVGMDLAMRLIPSSTEDQFEEITIVKDDELKESGLFKQYNSSDYKRIVKEHWGKLNLTLAAFKPPKLTYSISGSNAWVIGKEHSATGRPIMANDPHVGLAIPSIFHPVEMIEIDHNDNIITQAFGAGSDGVPGISIGKSLHFAWGSTSLYADSKDVFVEEILINENGNQSYLCDGKWIPLKIRKEIFKVRGSQDYEEVYPETHRGPLLSNLFIDFHLKYGFPMPNHHEKRLSFQMASYTKDSGKSIKATIDNIFSKTQQEFKAAGQCMQNINVDSAFISNDDPDFWGFALLGRIPKKNVPEMGSFIKNGTTTTYDQQESLTYEERPEIINPKRGYIAMTNNKFASDNYVHRSSLHEVSNGRSFRLEEILTSGIKEGKKFTIEDMMKMQQDNKDSYVEKVMSGLMKIFMDNKDIWVDREFGDKVVGWLSNWDCRFDRNLFEPSIYTIWQHEFQKLVLVDRGLVEAERIAITNHAFFELFYFNLVKRLASNNQTTTDDKLLCLNDFNKGSNKNPCIFNMIIAFNKLEASLKEWFGTLDSSQWKWGTIHTKTFTYVPWTEIPLIGGFFNRKIPADGNSRTLNVGIHSYQKKSFETFATAIFRFITDFNRTLYSVDLGVSDRVTSSHYDNFLQDFNNGKYVEHINLHPLRDKHNWTLTDSSFQSRRASLNASRNNDL